MRHVAPCCTSFYPHLHSSIRIPYPPADSVECPIGLRQGRAAEFVGNFGTPKKIPGELDNDLVGLRDAQVSSALLSIDTADAGEILRTIRKAKHILKMFGGEVVRRHWQSSLIFFTTKHHPGFLQAFGGERQRGAWADVGRSLQ